MLKSQKGITLVALVITIIVLIILAGVTVSMVVAPDGPIKRAQESKEAVNKSDVQEQISMAISNMVVKYYEEGAPEVKLNNQTSNSENIPSLGGYLYNDINSENSKINAALPAGYNIKSATIEEAKVIMNVEVKGNSYKAIYDAVEQNVVVE